MTFFLAIAGYAGLTLAAVIAAFGHVRLWLWRATVAVIVAHVILVWHVRYDWQFQNATRRGYAGFLIFHGALTLILLSLGLRSAVARRLIVMAFVVVTAGALGAVFREPDVAIYRIPVIALAVIGVSGLTTAARSALTRG